MKVRYSITPPSKVTVRKLRARHLVYGKRVEFALKLGMRWIRQEANRLVPVDTGKLQNSGVIRQKGRGLRTEMRLAYTADYAVYVHEDLTKAHGARFNEKYAVQIAAGIEHPRRPQETAKFLEIVTVGRRHSIEHIVRKAAGAK